MGTSQTARRVAGTALAATLLTGAITPEVATAKGNNRPELQQAIQEIVESGFTGVQLRVSDQQSEWTGSAGVRKLDAAAKPQTNGRFRVGSVTKTFTAALMLDLVADGKVGLDTSAASYLPEFNLDPRITVRMLLQHTSGVFNHTGQYNPDGTINPGIPWSGKEWVDNRFHTYQPEELVRLSLSKPLNFEPGTNWAYANTNYVLARLVIEKATGNSYAEEMRRRILRPLGLKGTIVPGTSPEIPGPHAHAYYEYEEASELKTVDITRQNPSWVSSGGDMISTTKDLQTFISALMSGKLLPASQMAKMLTPHPMYGYGLGLFVQDGSTPSPFPLPSCGAALVTHNGGVQGFATLMYSTPDGSKTLTASLTYVDDPAMSKQAAGYQAMQTLINKVFCA
ncbi:serine hydrolase domain-containing protein [Catelliglobosispora koreensis]|uniref:serine hydrolase domain-containing protein n=1 Tax=Catelliglobosispora koreensis TaxID=129052 RepID=UPI00037A1EF4|nr:serine hydrolase domain-containing protein [Catelliglobosispora koreensis]